MEEGLGREAKCPRKLTLGRGGSDSQRGRGRNEDRRKLGGYLREEGQRLTS